jgi:hypothetical protein
MQFKNASFTHIGDEPPRFLLPELVSGNISACFNKLPARNLHLHLPVQCKDYIQRD